MAWESVETNETEKGSYFPSMGSAPGRAALPLFFPMGWKGVPDTGNWRDRIALGIRRGGGGVGNDREKQLKQRKRDE